jgi:hypothetical protein
MFGTDIRDGGLDASPDGGNDTVKIVGGDTSCAKDVAIGKVLRCEVADGKF